MSTPLRPTARAALGGLVLGFIGAAFIFAIGAWNNARKACEYPDTEECYFELSTNADLARLQMFSALGCGLIGAGLYAVARRRP